MSGEETGSFLQDTLSPPELPELAGLVSALLPGTSAGPDPSQAELYIWIAANVRVLDLYSNSRQGSPGLGIKER